MRLALVNDSPLAVEALRRVAAAGGHSVAWIAKDGVEAVAACKADLPDLVLMDLRMPIMNGVESTRRIMQDSPCPILIVTATVSGHFAEVYDAMGAGALDAVNTPVLGRRGDVDGDRALLEKIEMIGKLVGLQRAQRRQRISQEMKSADVLPPLVAIGSSTGGPDALAKVLANIPVKTNAAIVIIQHVDKDFAPGLASWLSERSGFPTEVITEGGTPRPGVALVAATNDHVVLTPGRGLRYTPNPRRLNFRPSVDVFFHSLAEHWPASAVAALLTGMGSDGADGLLALRRAGWTTIAQDQATSVVYGMPRAAAELDAASVILPIGDIGGRITRALGGALPARR
jgi:two-component system response regulator WspF